MSEGLTLGRNGGMMYVSGQGVSGPRFLLGEERHSQPHTRCGKSATHDESVDTSLAGDALHLVVCGAFAFTHKEPDTDACLAAESVSGQYEPRARRAVGRSAFSIHQVWAA